MEAERNVSEITRDNSKDVVQSGKYEGDETENVNNAQKLTKVTDKHGISDGNKINLKPSEVNSSAKQDKDGNSNKEDSRKKEINTTDTDTVVEDKVNLSNENETRNDTKAESNASDKTSSLSTEGASKAEDNDGRQSIENKSNQLSNEEEHLNRGSKRSVGETNSSATSKETKNVVINSNSVGENKLEDNNSIKDSFIENSELGSTNSNLIAEENSETVTSEKTIRGEISKNESEAKNAKNGILSNKNKHEEQSSDDAHKDSPKNDDRTDICTEENNKDEPNTPNEETKQIDESGAKEIVTKEENLSSYETTVVEEKSRSTDAQNDILSYENKHEAQRSDDILKDSAEDDNRTDISTEDSNKDKPNTTNEITKQIDESRAKKIVTEQANLGSYESTNVEEKSRNTDAKNDILSNENKQEAQSSDDVHQESPKEDNKTDICTDDSNKDKPNTPNEETKQTDESGAKKIVTEEANLRSYETTGAEEKSRNADAENDILSNKNKHEAQTSDDVLKDSTEDDNRTDICTEDSNKDKPNTTNEITKQIDESGAKKIVTEQANLGSYESTNVEEKSRNTDAQNDILSNENNHEAQSSDDVLKDSTEDDNRTDICAEDSNKDKPNTPNEITRQMDENRAKKSLTKEANFGSYETNGAKEKSRNADAENNTLSNKNQHEAQISNDVLKNSPEDNNRTDICTEKSNKDKPNSPNEKPRQMDESWAKEPLAEDAKHDNDESIGVKEKSRITDAKNNSLSNKHELKAQISGEVHKDSPEDDNRTDIFTEENNKNKPNTPNEKTKQKDEVSPKESNNDDTAAENREEDKMSSETETKVIEDDNSSNKDRVGSGAPTENFVSSINNETKPSEDNIKKAEDFEESSQNPNNNEKGGQGISKDNVDDEKEAAYFVDVKGKGLQEAVAGVVGHFIVIIKPEEKEDNTINYSEYTPAIKITSEQDNNSIEPTIIDNEDGTFKINYMIQNVAKHAIEIKIKDKDVSGSPFPLNVIPLDIHSTAEILGLKSETYLGVEERFEIKLKQLGNERSNFLPDVQFQRTNQEKIIRPVFIEDNQDDSFTVSYLVCEEGDFRVHVRIEDKDISGSPFSIKVVSPAPFSTAEGEGLHEAFVGVPGNFVVTTRDASGNSICSPSCYPEIHISYPDQNGPVERTKVDDNEDGSFVVHYNFIEPRTYKIEIKIYDTEIPRSPFELKVELQQFTPLYEFGKEGIGEGLFQKPWGVAVNSEDNVIVTDRSQNSIQVFTSSGKYLKTIGEEGSGEGQLLQPTGIVCDKDDNIIVADTKNHRIQIFDKDGKFIRCFGTKGSGRGRLHTPLDLSMTSDGDIIVTDYGNQRVQVFDSQGKFQQKFCDRTEGKMDHPIDCVSLEDKYYVSEEDESCIKIYSKRGRFLYSFGSLGSLNGEFDRPFGLTVDKFNRLVVADSCNDRVQLFTKEGVFCGKFGKRGSELGCFKGPSAVEVLSDGKYVVSDSRNKRIQVFQ